MSRRDAISVPVPADIAAALEQQHHEYGKGTPSETGQAATKRLRLTRLSEVEATEPELLWGGRLVRNKINNFQGAGGLGKTFIANDIAARWTTGAPFPGELQGREPGTVLYLSAEDGASDTLKPRLEAAGGDPSRFYVSNATLEPDEDGSERVGSLRLQQVKEIVAAIVETGADLLVIDPVTSFLGAGVDMHKANEVRPVLEAFNVIAEQHRVTMLFVLHVGKTQLSPGQAAYRALGSVDFVNVARSIVMVGEQDGQRFLAHAKMNLSERADTLSYSLTPSEYRVQTRPVARVAWHGASDLTADDLFGAPGKRGNSSAFTDQEVEAAILDALTEPMSAQDLKTLIQDELDVSKHQFQAARAKLKRAGKIRPTRHAFGGSVVWERTDQPVYRGDGAGDQ